MKPFRLSALKTQIAGMIAGQLLLLGIIGALASYQVRLVEEKITEVADLKDPSPFTANLVGCLNRITLNLLSYVHNQNKLALQGIAQGEADFENSAVDFQKLNPRLFPLTAQTKILEAYQPFKTSIGESLHGYSDQLKKWDGLIDNNDQMVALFQRRLRPLIRPGQPLLGQRTDLVNNLENVVHSVPTNLTDYIVRHGGTEKAMDLNDQKFDAFLRIYEKIAPLRAEHKVLDIIDGLWNDNLSLAQQILQLEKSKTSSFTKMLQANQNLQTTISAVLPAVRPEIIEEKKNAIFHRITLILVVAGFLVLCGIASCVVSGVWVYRRVRTYFEEVRAIAEAAATGDLSRQVSIDGTKELDGMGQSVNRLIGVLRRSEQLIYQLGNIVESSGDASIGMNLDWVILSWNRGAHRMYGYTSDEIKGNFIDALFAPDRRQEVDVLREKLQEVKQVTFDTVHVRKSGVKIEVRLIASRILDTNGALIGISLLAREFPVTQRPLTPQSQPTTKPFVP